MRNRTSKTISNQIIYQKKLLDDTLAIKLNSILNSKQFHSIVGQCREYRERIFTPFITLMTFVKQVLDPDKSCRKAVAMVVAERLGQNLKPCSQNTGPYCKARQKLPEPMIKKIVTQFGTEAKNRSPHSWRWKGHNVNIVDGTTCLMPDTIANNKVYPKHNNQNNDIGVPIVRLLVIFSLATGVVLEYAMDAIRGKGTGEPSLLKRVLNNVMQTGDVLLGDSGFHSFFLLRDLMDMRCHGLFQAHPSWKINFSKGKRLGKKDYIVTWEKPRRSPLQMNPEIYHSYPKFIQVRVFKVGGHAYITTILDQKKYHKSELGELYRFRWQAEIHLGSIKSIMSMDKLCCKTPEMVNKEIGIHFIAYNIIRIIMAESGDKHKISPLQISFKNTLQIISSFTPWLNNRDKKINMEMYRHMLMCIAKVKIGNRPGRREPRAIKIRPRLFPILKGNRNAYRIKLHNHRALLHAAA